MPNEPNQPTLSLDQWYKTVNSIYLDRNFYRDAPSIFMHLVEVVGGLTLLGSGKRRAGVEPTSFLPAALGWWFALCGKVGLRSVEQMIWTKFPGVCPYCQRRPHNPQRCSEQKRDDRAPDWEGLEKFARQSDSTPRSLAQWQRLFLDIYPIHDTANLRTALIRFTEELGELAEAIRLLPITPGYFFSEAADVFAWLMHIANVLDEKAYGDNRGKLLETLMFERYPGRCTHCRRSVCVCPPLTQHSVARIGQEMPTPKWTDRTFLLTTDETRLLFRSGDTQLRIGADTVPVNEDVLKQIGQAKQAIDRGIAQGMDPELKTHVDVYEALDSLDQLLSSQTVTQTAFDGLVARLTLLPPPHRKLVVQHLTQVPSPIASALSALLSNR